jgi:hypothetical protein
MKAKEFKEKAGRLTTELAVAGGYHESYWKTVLHRDSEITGNYGPKIVTAVEDKIKALQALRRDLKRDYS